MSLWGGRLAGAGPCLEGALLRKGLSRLGLLAFKFLQDINAPFFFIVSVGTWLPSSCHIFYIRINIRPTGECLKLQLSKLSISSLIAICILPLFYDSFASNM